MLKYGGALKEAQIIYILKDISTAIAHLHQANVSHRDLKIENVMLSGKKFKLLDFGSALKEQPINDPFNMNSQFSNPTAG